MGYKFLNHIIPKCKEFIVKGGIEVKIYHLQPQVNKNLACLSSYLYKVGVIISSLKYCCEDFKRYLAMCVLVTFLRDFLVLGVYHCVQIPHLLTPLPQLQETNYAFYRQ